MNQEEKIIEQVISSKKVFILEDEKDIAELISINLQKSGFKTKEFYRATRLINYFDEELPDLIILDLMLPDLDGLEVCKYIRKEPKLAHIPIIMLTAKAEEYDKIIGLELGADDYMTKPFSPRELIARCKSILRREERVVKMNVIKVGDFLKIDLQKHEVISGKSKIELTASEFKILELLLERRGWVYSRNQILDRLDSQDKGVLDRTVDVHIKNLRVKLGESGKFIKNVRGVGYKFEE